jgi:hypothetical protein
VVVLAVQDRLTLCCTGATPLPLSNSVTGELLALLMNESDAVVVPDACGRNVTVNGTDCPAAITVGKVIPLSTNSALVLDADDSFTDELLAVTMPVSAPLEPSVTFPKFRVAGVSVTWPTVAPVPKRAMFNCESDALDKMARVPEIEPGAVGENTTLNVRLCPAERVAGNDSPLTVNGALDMLAPEIVTLALPMFVSVSVSVCEPSGRMLPKFRLAGKVESGLRLPCLKVPSWPR